jgi:hypothetical protein
MQLPRIGLTIIKASRADLRLMVAMIKDVIVRLDGTSGDDVRLAAVNQIAVIFESHITGLFFNVLPSLIPDGPNGAGANQATSLLDTAKEAGARVHKRSATPNQPAPVRRDRRWRYFRYRFAFGAYRRCFVALRPDGQSTEPEGLIENLLYGAGRHLFLVPADWKAMAPLDNVVIAWNGSRESARALTESLPYLHQAKKVGVLVVEAEHPTEADVLKGNDAVLHLWHHGINAVKYRAIGEEDEIADVRRVPQAWCELAGDRQLWPLASA